MCITHSSLCLFLFIDLLADDGGGDGASHKKDELPVVEPVPTPRYNISIVQVYRSMV